MLSSVALDLPRRRQASGPGHGGLPMPRSGPLVDRFGRVHKDLRLSVTDRCNLRCVYCMSEEHMTFLAPERLVELSGLARVAGVARRLGVTSVRLTGGEPLLRRGLVELVAALAAEGFADIAMTTNGTLLSRHAEALAKAGLSRVNISCDSLRSERFAAIRRRGRLDEVLSAMEAAEAVGLSPVKVNVVVMAGFNDDELVDFAAFARRTKRVVRFIEFMPLDAERGWDRTAVVPGATIVSTIDRHFALEPVPGGTADPAPAERFRFVDGQGEIGVVHSVTEPFCATCDRLRVTAEGTVRNCLFSDDELSLRPGIEAGSDRAIEEVLRQAVWGKAAGHGMAQPGFSPPRRSMSMIGG